MFFFHINTYVPPSRKLHTLSSRLDTRWNVSLMICCWRSSGCAQKERPKFLKFFSANFYSQCLHCLFNQNLRWYILTVVYNFQIIFKDSLVYSNLLLFRIGLKLPLPLQTTAHDDTVTYEILVKLWKPRLPVVVKNKNGLNHDRCVFLISFCW